jgi:hypothetical protein
MPSNSKGAPISADDAKKMISLYQQNNADDPFKTYYVLFAAEDLDTIRAQIDAQSGNGFAVYFGTYPADGSIPPADYANRNTVIFIPTIDKVPVFDPSTPPTGLTDPGGDGFNHGEIKP